MTNVLSELELTRLFHTLCGWSSNWASPCSGLAIPDLPCTLRERGGYISGIGSTRSAGEPQTVVTRSGRAPDSDQPAGALTYVAPNGEQTIYTFAPGGLAVIVEASPLMRDPEAAAGEYERYKAALTALYGAPVLEDTPRSGNAVPPVLDTVWTPGAPLRVVELTLDAVDLDGRLGHFVLVRTVGPDVNAPPGD